MSENIGGETNRNQDVPAQTPQETTPTVPSPSVPAPEVPAPIVPEAQAPAANVAADTNATERITPAAPYGQAPAGADGAGQPAEYPGYRPQPTQPEQRWQAPGQPYAATAAGAEQSANGSAFGQTPDQPDAGTHAGAGYPASNTYPHALAPAVTAGPKQRKKVGMGLFAASVVVAALVGGLVAGGTTALLGQQNSGTVASSNQQVAPLVVNNPTSVNQISAAAAKAMPSVVTISATSGTSGGTGSGIILNTNGDILTNTHVVTLDGAAAHATIQVQLSNNKVYAATVVGTDPLSDLAVVKINAPGLVPATLGDSNKLNVGDSVIAIGSPLGLNATVTEGIVSTLNRTIQVASSAVPSTPSDTSPDQGNGGNGFQFSPPGGGQSTTAATGSVNLNVIQTDAAINPGNSGGALVNANGQVIGVNVAIASTSSSSSSTTQSGNIGVGFSIPMDHARQVAEQIIAKGSATHGQLGVSVSGTSALGASSQFSDGATVASVTAGSAAAKGGLQAGDVIVQLGNRTITDASSLTAAVREQPGGSTVQVTLIRSGKTLEKSVTLDTLTN